MLFRVSAAVLSISRTRSSSAMARSYLGNPVCNHQVVSGSSPALRPYALLLAGMACGVALEAINLYNWWTNAILVGALLFIAAARPFTAGVLIAASATNIIAVIRHNIAQPPE